jgi:hypothetical protein
VAFLVYDYSENAEYDAVVKYSLLTVCVVQVLFFVLHIRRLHNVCVCVCVCVCMYVCVTFC